MPTPDFGAALEAALKYAAHGWSPVPIPFMKKGPVRLGWEALRLKTESEVRSAFDRGQMNVGVLLGEPSGWLVDVDLDCPEALRLAPLFLDATLRFGRASAPNSHWLFIAKGAQYAKYTMAATKPGEKPTTLVELRSGPNKQSVFPGSVHKSGEAVEFDPLFQGDDATVIDAADLAERVRKLAVASALLRQGVVEGEALARAEAGEAFPMPGVRSGESSASSGSTLEAFVSHFAKVAPAGTSDLSEAARRYNADHAKDWDSFGRKCPACGHEDCFGRLKGSDDRWSCFSASHAPTRCGREGKSGSIWFGDALDMAAHAAGVDRRELLRREGYLSRNYPMTDAGNAERFADFNRGRACYVKDLGGWLAYTGVRWERAAGATWLAVETLRAVPEQAKAIAEEEVREKVIAFARASENWKYLNPMVKIAEGLLKSDAESFDANPLHFNMLNGTLDLEAGALRPHAGRDRILKLAPVTFDPAATCPTWERFLARIIPDSEVRAYLQRALGYSLSGLVKEEAFCFFHGGGRNGKTTLIKTMQAVMGDYARQAAPSLLLKEPRGGSRHTTELVDLKGARFVASTEVEQDQEFDEVLVKRLTGGDSIKGRYMQKDFIEFIPTHKLFLMGNHKPAIRGTDLGIWRRVHLVPFGETITDGEKDGDLGAKLKAEGPGVINWLLEGFRSWRARGLAPPPKVLEATKEYRQSQDQIGRFLDECFEKGTGDGFWTTYMDINSKYRMWCLANSEVAKGGNSLTEYLKQNAGCVNRTQDNKRGWAGLRAKDVKDTTKKAQVAGPTQPGASA